MDGLFVDENVIGLGFALAAARDDVVHPGHDLLPEVPRSTLDPDWIPIVAAKQLIVLTRDKSIKSKPAERQLLLDGGLRVVALTGAKNMDTWEMLGLVVRKWAKLEKFCKQHANGPWWASWTTSGLTRRV